MSRIPASRLVLGFSVGLLLALAMIFSIPAGEHDLIVAREMGLISYTTLIDYSEAQEVRNYIIALITVPAAMALFGLWRRRNRDALSNATVLSRWDVREGNREPFWREALFFLVLAGCSWNTEILTGWMSDPMFFFEEGYHLAWIQSILDGRLLFRDVVPMFGPLVDYPAALLAHVFGLSIPLWRGYLFVLNLAGIFITYLLLQRLLKSRSVLLLGTCLFLFAYAPGLPGTTWSISRVASGLLALLPFFSYLETGKTRSLILSSVLAVVSLLFSQDSGISVILAIVIILAVRSFAGDRPLMTFARCAGIFLGIAGAGFAGAVSAFAYYGAGGAFVTYLFRPVISYASGYAALPYPSLMAYPFFVLSTLSWKEWSILWCFYWPILLFLYLGGILVIRLVKREADPGFWKVATVFLFGIIFYRTVLGRSDSDHLLYALTPTLILALWGIDRIWQTVREDNSLPAGGHALLALAALLLAGCIVSVLRIPIADINANRLIESNLQWKYKIRSWKPSPDTNLVLAGLPKASNIYMPAPTAAALRDITRIIDRKIPPGGTVYAFPNLPMLYYLSGRPSASSFIFAQLAATRDERIQIVKELKTNSPRLVIRMQKSIFDGFSADILLPEIAAHIEENYTTIHKWRMGFELLEARVFKRETGLDSPEAIGPNRTARDTVKEVPSRTGQLRPENR